MDLSAHVEQEKSYSIKIEMACPSSLNIVLRMYRMERQRYYDSIYAEVYYQTLRKIPMAPLKKARLTFIRYSNRFLDFDNFVSSLKPIVDGLVRAKILANDTWDITGPWAIDQQKTKKTDKHIMLVRVEAA